MLDKILPDLQISSTNRHAGLQMRDRHAHTHRQAGRQTGKQTDRQSNARSRSTHLLPQPRPTPIFPGVLEQRAHATSRSGSFRPSTPATPNELQESGLQEIDRVIRTRPLEDRENAKNQRRKTDSTYLLLLRRSRRVLLVQLVSPVCVFSRWDQLAAYKVGPTSLHANHMQGGTNSLHTMWDQLMQ